jgi:type IV fimbrial biogenesis protein FimT
MTPPPAALPRPGLSIPARRRRGRAPRGFTLLEAMVVMAVLVVVMAVGMPAMSEFAANNQVSATRSAFTTAVSLARTEAARRGVPVLIQPRSSGPAGNAYGPGWEIVVDADADGQAGSTEERVRRHEALPVGVRLDGGSPLVFRATGWLDSSTDVSFTVCQAVGAAQGYRVTVTPSGVADVTTASPCP